MFQMKRPIRKIDVHVGYFYSKWFKAFPKLCSVNRTSLSPKGVEAKVNDLAPPKYFLTNTYQPAVAAMNFLAWPAAVSLAS